MKEILTSKGIAFSPTASKRELSALLPDGTDTAEIAAGEEDHDSDEIKAVEPEAEKVTAPVAAGSFAVYNLDGILVRTYTAHLHGEEASEYANEFAGKVHGKDVSS